MQKIVSGIVAGAAGTVALDVATYLDMAIRGRSASNSPAQLVDTVTKSLHLSLSSGDAQQAKNRESGLGALLGYVNGLGTGLVYSLIRSQQETIPLPLAAIGIGLAAMASSDVPLIVSHVSNPKTWGASGWLSDLIPHMIYGLVTAVAYESLTSED